VGSYVLGFVGLFMALVSAAMPIASERTRDIWFSMPDFLYLLPIPLLTLVLFVVIWRDLHGDTNEVRPFVSAVMIFLLGYFGIAISLFPWIVPFNYTIWDAAASGPGLSLMLLGVGPFLPLTLSYTAYCYYIFRGKSSHEAMY
jgi:cytochrome d ubiquinol oxidase subunit II